MKLTKLEQDNGFLVPGSGSRWIGWYHVFEIKGYTDDTGRDIGYHEFDNNIRFFI